MARLIWVCGSLSRSKPPLLPQQGHLPQRGFVCIYSGPRAAAGPDAWAISFLAETVPLCFSLELSLPARVANLPRSPGSELITRRHRHFCQRTQKSNFRKETPSSRLAAFIVGERDNYESHQSSSGAPGGGRGGARSQLSE